MLQGGMQLLDRFAQEDRVRILSAADQFAGQDPTFAGWEQCFRLLRRCRFGEFGQRALRYLTWKTSTSCYPSRPAGLCALDPQMICYSWMTGIERVAAGRLVRKRMPEIQYIKATISDQQRQEYGRLVEETVRQIEAHSSGSTAAYAFPQNHV